MIFPSILSGLVDLFIEICGEVFSDEVELAKFENLNGLLLVLHSEDHDD